MSIERVTTVTLRAMKARRERISLLTATDPLVAWLEAEGPDAARAGAGC